MGKIALFLRIHGSFRRHNVARATGLYFNKTQCRAIPAHEIKLTAAARAAVITGNDYVTLLAEIKVCCFFTTASGMEMLRAGVFVRKEPGKRIESAKRKAG
jgi:hypothetical protein